MEIYLRDVVKGSLEPEQLRIVKEFLPELLKIGSSISTPQVKKHTAYLMGEVVQMV